MSGDIYQKGNESPNKERSRDIDQKEAYISNVLQLQNQSSIFDLKNKSLFSAASLLSC